MEGKTKRIILNKIEFQIESYFTHKIKNNRALSINSLNLAIAFDNLYSEIFSNESLFSDCLTEITVAERGPTIDFEKLSSLVHNVKIQKSKRRTRES